MYNEEWEQSIQIAREAVCRNPEFYEMFMKDPLFRNAMQFLNRNKVKESELIKLIYDLCKSNEELTRKLIEIDIKKPRVYIIDKEMFVPYKGELNENNDRGSSSESIETQEQLKRDTFKD